MWARKRLDIGWFDSAAGLLRLVLPVSAPTAATRLEQALPQGEQALACLSVRSGFDLVFRTLAWPRGSEVIFSAVTIHDMPRIAVENGLVPVPADLDLVTMAPTIAALEAARTEKTRALVIAHLFGARLDLAPYADFCRRYNLVLIEDCAQAWAGPQDTGDSLADVSMFSFGTIKSATAYGGAVFYIRRADWLPPLRAALAADPVASRGWFLSRLIKNNVMKAVSLRPWYGLFLGVIRRLGKDYDKVVNGSVRGFPGPEFLARIRKRMPAALAGLLRRRLTRYDSRRLAVRAEHGRRLTGRLIEKLGDADTAARCPTVLNPQHNFWVYPVLAADPPALIRRLYAAGFDATQGQSLCAVPPPPGRESLRAIRAERFLREVVFLPIYPDLTPRALERLADALVDALSAAAATASAAPLTATPTHVFATAKT